MKKNFFFVFVCNFEVIQYPIVVAAMALKPTVAIIGSGWGGYNLAHALDAQKYKVVVISPEATSAITPFMAGPITGQCSLRTLQFSIGPRAHPTQAP